MSPTGARRLLVLAVCCSSLFLVSLDNTALNVALPAMQRDLRTSVTGLQWTIDAYLIVLAALLLFSGALGDRLGHRRVFRTGLALFTASSVLCSLAPDAGWLIVFRTMQAVGGSMLNPAAMALLTNVFTGRRERARAIGVWSTVQGVTMAVGPLIGGLLTDAAGWRWIFLLNVPVGVLALTLTGRVPEARAGHPRRPDPVGQLLVIVLLATLVYVIIQAPVSGWTAAPVVACAGAVLLALPALLRVESSRREPLIELRFFRQPAFTAAVLSAILAFAAMGGFLFLAALYWQNIRHLAAWEAGVRLLPMAVMTIVCPPLAGRLTATRGPRPPLIASGAATALSGLLCTVLDAPHHSVLLLTSYALFGIGFGLINAPITDTAVSGMPRAQVGVASAITATSRQVGNALGVAVIGAVLAADAHADTTATFLRAARPAWWIITVCGAGVLALAALLVPSQRRDRPRPASGSAPGRGPGRRSRAVWIITAGGATVVGTTDDPTPHARPLPDDATHPVIRVTPH
ncbi:MFS transporter [Streptomyces sp. NPDC056149]|uniref:MFS transporter n=1 Tax=Streptomyces sp. NPDC056149 TaxID=3345728 RepID=UPI0035DB8D06